MTKFKLVSEFKPCGDQPKAIEALTKRLLTGERHSTLLGVTGSGKSLPPEEPIWVYDNCNGKLTPILIPIGTFVDWFLKEETSINIQGDTQTLLLSSTHPRYYTFSINPATLETELRPVAAVHRHSSPKTLWKVITTCGRSVRVTEDHNLWVLRKGQLRLLKTDEIRIGDYIPLPISLPKKETKLDSVSLIDIFEEDKHIFVHCQKQLAGLSGHDMWQLGKVIRQDAQGEGYSKLRRAAMCGERISIADVQVLKSHGVAFDLESSKVGVQHGQREIPLTMPITEDLLEFVGYFLAEGHAEDRFLLVSCAEPEIQDRLQHCLKNLGITWRLRPNGYDYQISWSIYARLFANWCGRRSKEKRLPYFWPQLSQAQLGLLLSAYFTGDGGVEHDEVTVTTASRQLASDLTYALTQLGLWPRIAKRFKRATNSMHKGDFYYRLSISGMSQLKTFAEHINFLSERKRRQLNSHFEKGKEDNTNVDVIPISGKEIAYLRTALNLCQKSLAGYIDCNRSMISLIESEKRRPSRDLFEKIIKAFEVEVRKKDCVDLLKRLNILKQLSAARWTQVCSLSQETSQCKWVYDLSVSNNETFLAGFGGIFVHNTFTMANVIANIERPTLVISHNKTLAAQLYSEFKMFFPENAVEYFVSYYDYYQPEAYIPQTDTYIEKDASINDDLDRLRLSSTSSLMSRDDVIIVASVSCIYNLGSPSDYADLLLFLEAGQEMSREQIMYRLVEIQYERNDIDFRRGKFRVRGDVIEIFPAYKKEAVRVELAGGIIEKLTVIDPLTGTPLQKIEKTAVYPAKHFVMGKERIERALVTIEAELNMRVEELKGQNKLLEAQRLLQRTRFDMEMLKEIGYCHGVENYSRHLSERQHGSRPYCLIDYFLHPVRHCCSPMDANGVSNGARGFLTIIDESHVTIPQLRGMYEGDRARKEVLVDYGFRLPSCLDNRPLRFDEFESLIKQLVFTSATPGVYEIQRSKTPVEQIIRPTGLVDPEIVVKPSAGQIDDLIEQIRRRSERKERVLVTTLTKKMAEDLSRYLNEMGLNVKYLHSEIETIERVEILRDLRLRKFDAIVGINLLREGLDLPEVSLVAILDADKEGFLRSQTSLIQVAGRAARNINGQVIMYADVMTNSMRNAIAESSRRRKIQLEYNRKNNITPKSIEKAIIEGIEAARSAEEVILEAAGETPEEHDLNLVISELEYEMELAARNLQFEKAAGLRDKIRELKAK